MSALGQGLAPLAAEFAGNARLRWGVWLILGIALFYCILSSPIEWQPSMTTMSPRPVT